MVLQLSKDEIPIWNETGFYLPIHPRLLDPNARFDPKLAHDLFPQAAEEWYDDLQMRLQNDEDLGPEMKEFFAREYLGEKRPKISKEKGVQRMGPLSWEDRVHTDERGFAQSFMISRNFGGSIYFNKRDISCRTSIKLNGEKSRFFAISREKAQELCCDRVDEDYGEAQIYAQHNVDYYPGALFLRNWGILYINAALKAVS